MDQVIIGMKQVKVRCKNLLEELVENRNNHLGEYTSAMAGYQDELVAKLEERVEEAKQALQDAKDGNLDDIHDHRVPKPESHEKEYDRAIKMVEMSVGDEMVLDQHEFDQYVMDDWNWKDQFVGTTSIYNNKFK